MSIWDDITKGLSDATSYTKKKTGEFTNLAKLKYALHSEESKLSECFEEIGKLYYAYQREGVDYAAEIAALIAEADMIKITIGELEAEIAKTKKQTICPSCGAKPDQDMAFCPSCGAKLEKTEESAPESDCGCDCGCDCGDDTDPEE